jgi:hypothetical protein
LLPAISAARLVDASETPNQFGAISNNGRGMLTFASYTSAPRPVTPPA